MSEEVASNAFLHAIDLNAKRRKQRFVKFKARGAMWMLECQDLWDFEDDDAGVYFVDCATGYEVDDFLKGMDPSSDRLLGIYDLSKPLTGQGPGLTLEEWKAR